MLPGLSFAFRCRFRALLRVMGKELTVSLLCGLTLAVCNFAKLMLFDRVSLAVALVVCVTLLFTVVASKLVGSALPMLAKRVGFDPTVMASPLITTVVDVLSLLIYFQAATMILGL